MTCQIELLGPNRENEYETFIQSFPTTMIYASLVYRDILREFIPAEPKYLIALDDSSEIIGALPAFISRANNFPPVINSLPFYGSNGGVIADPARPCLKKSLIEGFNSLARQHGCAASTIVTSPFSSEDIGCYEEFCRHDFRDERIGQITCLPDLPQDGRNVKNLLMGMYHQKTRNMVRKAEKSGVSAKKSLSEDDWKFLSDTHQENMREIGGLAKPKSFFSLIDKHLTGKKSCSVYTAFFDRKPIGALLVLYYNRTAEYFTPVVLGEYRSFQPLSMLICQAMQDAVEIGCRFWNWGGTWLNQDGVYDFKKRWGTKDFPYYYYTKVYDHSILACSKNELLEHYPYFYVLPFSALKGN